MSLTIPPPATLKAKVQIAPLLAPLAFLVPGPPEHLRPMEPPPLAALEVPPTAVPLPRRVPQTILMAKFRVTPTFLYPVTILLTAKD